LSHFVVLWGGDKKQGEERGERVRMGGEGEAMLT